MSPGRRDGHHPVIDLTPACRVTGTLIAGLHDDELRLATPCDELDVAGLVDHLDLVARGFVDLTVEPSPPDPDPRPSLPAALDRLARSWSNPARWEGSTDAGTELPNATWGRIALTEVVVHGWDLSRAVGRPVSFDDETLRVTLEHVLDFVPASLVPAALGQPATLPDDAPLLDRIVAATGRQVQSGRP